MAIKEISVTLINKQRRVDCLAAIGPPFSYQTVPSAPLFSQRHKVIQPYILGLKRSKNREKVVPRCWLVLHNLLEK